ncbi:MAG TPA: hypothetical protein VG142_00010 [Trebonia sp.]|nr:hypothetical protein [Trebonia sp.]
MTTNSRPEARSGQVAEGFGGQRVEAGRGIGRPLAGHPDQNCPPARAASAAWRSGIPRAAKASVTAPCGDASPASSRAQRLA